jgi:hypothetical protein
LILSDRPQAEPGAAIGSLLILAGMIVFAVNVLRGTRT